MTFISTSKEILFLIMEVLLRSCDLSKMASVIVGGLRIVVINMLSKVSVEGGKRSTMGIQRT